MCYPYTHRCRVIYWSMVYLPRATALLKADSPSPRSHKPPIAPNSIIKTESVGLQLNESLAPGLPLVSLSLRMPSFSGGQQIEHLLWVWALLLGQVSSSSVSHHLSLASQLGLGPHDSLTHAGTLASLFSYRSCANSHSHRVHVCSSYIVSWKHCSAVAWLLQPLCLLIMDDPWALGGGVGYRCSI